MADKKIKASRRRYRAEPETVFYKREACLHTEVICDKNPGHRGFIPLNNFTKNHFPGGCRDEWRYNYIMAACDLTAHLTTNTVSADRPQFYPNSDDPFPFYHPGGGHFPHLGTGFVIGVYHNSNNASEKFGSERRICKCPECLESEHPERRFWIIEMVTAAHVTFDQSEVVNTHVKFFFDSKDSKTYSTRGYKCLNTHAEGDRCRFLLFIHDSAVANRLGRALEKCMDIRGTYFKCGPAGPVIVISHPHGLIKHITVGKRTNTDYATLNYTAATCDGSSGGVVIFRRKDGMDTNFFNFGLYPHSGCCVDGSNMSGRIMHWLW